MSFRVKFLAYVFLPVTVVFGTSFVWFLRYVNDQAFALIKEDQLNIMTVAVKQIDVDSLVALYQTGQPNAAGFSDDPRYRSGLDELEKIHQLEPHAWVGTYFVDGEDIIFITDLWAHYDPSKAATFKYVCRPVECSGGDPKVLRAINLAKKAVRDGTVELSGEFVTDQWGSWSSGWAPLRDRNGHIVAGLFLDFEASYFQQVQNEAVRQVAITFGLAYTILILAFLFASRAVLTPIQRLTSAVKAVGASNYRAAER
jgi:hypothetical protein